MTANVLDMSDANVIPSGSRGIAKSEPFFLDWTALRQPEPGPLLKGWHHYRTNKEKPPYLIHRITDSIMALENPYKKASRFLISVLHPVPKHITMKRKFFDSDQIDFIIYGNRFRNDVGSQWLEGYIETHQPIDVATLRRDLNIPHAILEVAAVQDGYTCIEAIKNRCTLGTVAQHGVPMLDTMLTPLTPIDTSTDDENEF